MTSILLKNCSIFDGINEEIRADSYVIVEDTRIVETGQGAVKADNKTVIDCGRRVLMPGLIDAHFHAYTPTMDMQALDRMPPSLITAHAASILKGTLLRGFTTVRDAAGGDVGLAKAIEQGLIKGPRFLFSGKGISQTGGHGDFRPGDTVEPCGCAGYDGSLTMVADGEDGVRRAAREELRKGATQIKLFLSGGVISPSDPIWMRHFTDDEIRAGVEEAASRRTYVMAHCHTSESARRCAELGIRSIEHGTQIDDATAKFLAEKGTFVVPTLSIFDVIQRNSGTLSLPPASQEKIQGVCERALQSIESCERAGVKLGFGTDLLDHRFHPLQGAEFQLRAEASPAINVLRSATSVNAEILCMADEIGCIKPGASADIILLNGNPLENLELFRKPENGIPFIMKEGVVYKNTLKNE